jgi:hypothetical protein
MTAPLQTISTTGVNNAPSLSILDNRKERESQQSASFGEPEYTFGDRVRIWITGYCASFILTGVMIPIVSSAILVIIYLSFPDLVVNLSPIVRLDSHSAWHILFLAHLSTIVLWLMVALVRYPDASVQSANAGSYGLLKGCLCHLRAKLGINGTDHDLRMLEKKCEDIKEAIDQIRDIHKPLEDTNDDRNHAALTTALASYIDIRKLLYHSPTGLLWAFGFGYCTAWRLVHQAEEAIIEFDGIQEIIYGAMRDKMALQGSEISAKDELLDTLIHAVMVLQPAAGVYLKEHQPDKNSITLADLKERAFEEFLSRQGISLQQDNNDTSNMAKATARSALRRVKRALNTLQDRGWEGLLRARNRLLAAIAITGIATHIMLCITILTAFRDRDSIIAATAFYLVGAISGLFGRFYQESLAGSAVDDFGFSTARLIATPLLSGLAGIGGVLVLITLTALGGSALHPSNGQLALAQIFDVKPQSLLMAAVFGLTPNLLIKGLQNTARKYESAIQSSRITEQGTADKKA